MKRATVELYEIRENVPKGQTPGVKTKTFDVNSPTLDGLRDKALAEAKRLSPGRRVSVSFGAERGPRLKIIANSYPAS